MYYFKNKRRICVELRNEFAEVVNGLTVSLIRTSTDGGSKIKMDPGSCGDPSDSPLDAGLHHVAGHQLEPLLQVFGEFRLRPVEVQHEHLQGIQLPEKVFGGGRAVTAGRTR